jgi:hypothetical protein
MIAWILILTLEGGDHAFIAQIPGFQSEQACDVAGERWIKDMGGYGNGFFVRRATCIKLNN